MDELKQAHAKLLHDTAIQFHFPAAAPPSPITPPVGPPFSMGDGSALFWIVLTVAVIGIALVVVQQLRIRRTGKRASAPAAPNPGAAPVGVTLAAALPAVALDEADVLAGQGRYGDAVHALLLRGIGAIERQFPRALAPSATSRDIARLPALPEAMRHAFAGIAERTERAVFARATLAQADWEACRALYAGLVPAHAHGGDRP